MAKNLQKKTAPPEGGTVLFSKANKQAARNKLLATHSVLLSAKVHREV